MKNLFVLNVLILFIINLNMKNLHGAFVKNTSLDYVKQIHRAIRQTNVGACVRPTILNGKVDIIRQKIDRKRNSLSVNITCDDNYILQPPEDFNIQCLNGMWDVDEMPQCKRCTKHSYISDTEINTDTSLICPESLHERVIYEGCGQGSNKIHQPFIVNGTISKFAEFPWHIAIYKKESNDQVPLYHCGGSIINDKNILTVAHCFSDGYGKIIASREYYAAAGKFHVKYNSDNETSQRRKIIRINLHPLYKGELTNHAWDIAVATVHEPFQISSIIHPICIDWKTQYENEQLSADKYGKIAGWGKTETNLYDASSELRVLKVPFIERKECFKFVPSTFIKYITHDKFCAGYMNGSSVCDGDSGGGLVFERQENGKSKYYIRGLVSVGLQNNGRCDEYKYSTYTKVSEYISFIRDSVLNKDNLTATTFNSTSTTPILETTGNKVELSVSCKTPNNEEAKCISIYDCKIFVNALENSPTKNVINYMKDSVCGKEGEKKVCCGSTINYLSIINSNPIISEPIEHKNLNLLPKPGVCGKQAQFRKGRIIGGIVADIHDYPWMALLYFNTTWICSGFLINERYVVTAANCLKSRSISDKDLVRVRLGEFDTDTENDCVNSICTDPPVNIDIEEIIVHPSFNYRKRIADIALLRLAKNVSYTDFIQPICLPVNRETSMPGRKVYMAGWGHQTEIDDERYSSKKIKISVYVAPHELCEKAYNGSYSGFTVHSSHLCVGGEAGKDSCEGDAGGPVMATLTNSKYLYAEGIISFGRYCARTVPSINTRVASYMEWILETIKP